MKLEEKRTEDFFALNLGTHALPEEGVDMKWVPAGETHTFRSGDIAYVDCRTLEGIDERKRFQKFGFTEGQTVEGPMMIAEVPGATPKLILRERRKFELKNAFKLLAFFAVFASLASLCLFIAHSVAPGSDTRNLAGFVFAISSFSASCTLFLIMFGLLESSCLIQGLQKLSSKFTIRPNPYAHKPLQAG